MHLTSESSHGCSVGRSPGITSDAIRERDAFIIGAFLAGLSCRKTLEVTNALSGQKQWGKLGTVRSVQRVVAGHFQHEAMTPYELKRYMHGLREAAFSQQEMCIERLARYMHSRPLSEWEPRDYMRGIKTLNTMIQRIIDARGWNASKRAHHIVPMGRTQKELYEEYSEELQQAAREQRLQPLLDVFEAYLNAPAQVD